MHFKSACCKSLPWFYSRGGSIMAAKKNWPSLLSRKWYNTKYRLYWYWTMTLVDLSSLTGMWWQLLCLSFCWLTPTKKESPTTLRDPSLLLVTLSLSLVSFLSHLPPVVLLNTRMDSWANSIPWISWPDPHRRNPNIFDTHWFRDKACTFECDWNSVVWMSYLLAGRFPACSSYYCRTIQHHGRLRHCHSRYRRHHYTHYVCQGRLGTLYTRCNTFGVTVLLTLSDRFF